MKKFVTFMVAMMLCVPSFLAADQPAVPGCPCERLFYVGSPWIPPLESGIQLDGIWYGLPGVIFYYGSDVGDLPYSVPGFGWHSHLTDALTMTFDANIYAMPIGINISLSKLACCSATPQVGVADGPLFSEDGVTLEWSPGAGMYYGSVGNHTFAAIAYSPYVIKVFEQINHPSHGHLLELIYYHIQLPAEGYWRMPHRMEVR
jgi:hypothetical protein